MLKMIPIPIRTLTPLIGLAFAMSACSKEPEQTEQASPDQMADKLDQAADQSDPAAAKVIEKRADELRGMESAAPAGQPGSYAQDTMSEAGAAAAPSGSAKQ